MNPGSPGDYVLPIVGNRTRRLIHISHLIDDIAADSAVAEILLLLRGQLEDLPRRLKFLQNLLIIKSRLLQGHDFVESDKSVAINIGGGRIPRISGRGRTGLRLLRRGHGSFPIIRIIGIGATGDDISARRAEHTPDDRPEAAIAF